MISLDMQNDGGLGTTELLGLARGEALKGLAIYGM